MSELNAGADDADTGAPPASAAGVFGPLLPAVTAYVARLASDGVTRGLIGPREAPRIWDRHLLNCAVLAELIPLSASVIDGPQSVVWDEAENRLHVQKAIMANVMGGVVF